jgi:S1-C subfamily serine protease
MHKQDKSFYCSSALTLPSPGGRGDTASPLCKSSVYKLLNIALATLIAAVSLSASPAARAAGKPILSVIDSVQPKIVKIYGAGGFRGLEGYQSGILVSAEGHILTAWSHVLDTDYATAVLDDGRRFEAKLLGADPRLEVAVLKIEAAELPWFNLAESVRAEDGTRVLAVSNAFNVAAGNERATVQDSIISVTTNLSAHRGVFDTPYRGPVYVLDTVTNNPGAAGGAVVTRRGQLTALLGKPLLNSMNNTWLNYALPIEELRKSVDEIRSGKFVQRSEKELEKKPAKALTLSLLGVALVPNVLERTPPYIDAVRAGSPAAKADIRPDDLIVLIGDHLIQSCKSFLSELEYIDYEDPVTLSILRGQDLVICTVQYTSEEKPKTP